MNKLNETLKLSAPIILRVGMSFIFIWFGIQQIIHTSMWTSFIPQFVIDISNLSASTLTHLNGSFEIVFGIALLIGYFTRLSALLLAVHMLDITFVVGYNSVGIRDLGLSFAAIAIFLYGSDLLSLDNFFLKNKPANLS